MTKVMTRREKTEEAIGQISHASEVLARLRADLELLKDAPNHKPYFERISHLLAGWDYCNQMTLNELQRMQAQIVTQSATAQQT